MSKDTDKFLPLVKDILNKFNGLQKEDILLVVAMILTYILQGEDEVMVRGGLMAVSKFTLISLGMDEEEQNTTH